MEGSGVGEVAQEDIEPICINLRNLLDLAVKRNLADCILLSGGLDTSILAAVASRYTSLTGITVAAGRVHEDLEYAKAVASQYGIKHVVVTPTEDEILRVLPDVIRVVKSYDPMEINGSVAAYLGLIEAKQRGFDAVMTGDGGDELFAGYTFYYKLSRDELEQALQRTWKVMSFSSRPLAASLGINARLPYLDEQFMNMAMQIDSSLKVREERGIVWGKWILRKAYEGILPSRLLWRSKLHIGAGSGVNEVLSEITSLITDEEYEAMKMRFFEDDGVVIRSREGLLYYRVFRQVVGVPRRMGEGEKTCPDCMTHLREGANYCRVCGAYPI